MSNEPGHAVLGLVGQYEVQVVSGSRQAPFDGVQEEIVGSVPFPAFSPTGEVFQKLHDWQADAPRLGADIVFQGRFVRLTAPNG